MAAVAAGRLFHRVRALACEPTLSGRPLPARPLAETVAPAFVRVVGAMPPAGAGRAERELGRWVRGLAEWLGGIGHIERPADQQRTPDALTG